MLLQNSFLTLRYSYWRVWWVTTWYGT